MDAIDELLIKVEKERHIDYEAMEYGGEHFEDVGTLVEVCRKLNNMLLAISYNKEVSAWIREYVSDGFEEANAIAKGGKSEHTNS